MFALTLALVVHAAHACGVEGTAVYKDGSKVNSTATISSSWNSKVAVPKNGTYLLDLGSDACSASVTVYIDGNQGQRVTLPSSGNATANFVAR